MADNKITELTELTTPALADLLAIVDDPAGTPISKKMAIDKLWSILNPPSGFLINGKIVPSVASNNLTVALKGMDGNDPSATNPVYVKIGSTIRAITAALSTTLNAGFSYFLLGSAEFATKEADLFVYLGYSTTASAMKLTFARFPDARVAGDFTIVTSESEKYGANGNLFASTDELVNIGRFAATLSAGAGYTWSVPTFTATNLIQRPIYETRILNWLSVLSSASGAVPTYSTFTNKYQISGGVLRYWCNWENSSGGTAGSGADVLFATLPFANADYVAYRSHIGSAALYENGGTTGIMGVLSGSASNKLYLATAALAAVLPNDQSSAARFIEMSGQYQI